jgi:deazaflavin-dependent oxidoreductase (nitroreductase family)
MAVDLTSYTKQSTVRLSTSGRKSGRQHTVTIWFVVADPRRVHVQHVRGATADWYRNLSKQPAVQLDFGGGPVAGHATPITDANEVHRVLGLFRRKYIFAWVFQLLGMTKHAAAATIEVLDPAS